MELFTLLLDFVLHVDRYLDAFVRDHGTWVYLLLFLIVFVETGVVVMPFLPGDSLLFVVGALCGAGVMDYSAAVTVLLAAAILGDQCNYLIGRQVGPRVFQWEQSRFFNRNAFLQANAFYEKHGPVTLIVARFLPFIRTFAPFVAGVGSMKYSRFVLFCVVGGALWVSLLTLAGYYFGSMPIIRNNFEMVVFGIIGISLLPVLFGILKQRFGKA
jgi:membrane-associated protein